MTQALLCVSFGTTWPEARAGIDRVEEVLAAAVPQRRFARAFTSGIIRRTLARRGETVLGVAEALEQLAQAGTEDVLVQPTHLLPGREYDKLLAEAAPWAGRFHALRMGAPLLGGTEDLARLAEALDAAYPARPGEALVLFGHGTDHFANMVYPALQTAFRLLGRRDVLVGTVEGWPGYGEVASQLAGGGWRRVHLAPLMLVAGDHALHDMTGTPDSWQARLEAAGHDVRWTIRGLGEIPGVQELYRSHLMALLEADHGV